MTASHLDFYTRYGISPVRQDISDLRRHFERREALYRHLGLLPGFFPQRTVLEVGPGGGYNSIYTASLAPSRYVLVEGNPTGVVEIRQLFAGFPELASRIEIVHSSLEAYRPDTRFDFVFCEGLLSGVQNPEEILAALAAATAPGGVLVVTAVDHLSHFPETIRRAFAQRAIDPEEGLEQKVAKILPMMLPHLATLWGMSRRQDDWVIDNLLHPGSIIPLINFPGIAECLRPNLEFYAASPHFATDWRWYKAVVGEDRRYSDAAVETWWANAHSLLDYRTVLPPRDAEENRRLYALCTEARRALELFEAAREEGHFDRFLAGLEHIVAETSRFSPAIAEALREASTLLGAARLDPAKVASASKFGPLFGRGQQYFSFAALG
jgi:SAM-dependent methyltransferase